MTKILSRALSVAAVAGIATLAATAPAIADPTPPGLLGDSGLVDTFGQHQRENGGSFGSVDGHSPHLGTLTPTTGGDAPLVDVTNAVDTLSRPLIAL